MYRETGRKETRGGRKEKRGEGRNEKRGGRMDKRTPCKRFGTYLISQFGTW